MPDARRPMPDEHSYHLMRATDDAFTFRYFRRLKICYAILLLHYLRHTPFFERHASCR